MLAFRAPDQISTFPSWVWKVEKLHTGRDASGQEVNAGCWWLMADVGHSCCKNCYGHKNFVVLKGIYLKIVGSVSYKLLALC